MTTGRTQIFHDSSGKRWQFIKRLLFWSTIIISIGGTAFLLTLLFMPMSPLSVKYRYNLKKSVFHLPNREHAEREFVAAKVKSELRKQISLEKHNTKLRSKIDHNPITVGFYVNWEDPSYTSFRNHVDDLTYVMPEWLALTPDGQSFTSRWSKATNDPLMEKVAREHKVPIIPMLDNISGGLFKWEPMRALLSNTGMQNILAGKLVDYLKMHDYAGINVDLEPPYQDIKPADTLSTTKLVHDKLPGFITILKQRFKQDGLLVTEDVPAEDESFDLTALSKPNDFIVVMLYDQHTPSSDPGPIASINWIEEAASRIFADIDSSKIVLGIGNYGYDWPVKFDHNDAYTKTGNGSKVFLGDALKTAGIAKSPIYYDNDLNPYYSYSDTSNIDHLVYYLDATTAYNTLQSLKGYKPGGAALWYLGSEDPTIWSIFNPAHLFNRADRGSFSHQRFNSLTEVSQEMKGEVVEIVSQPKSGSRMVHFDNDGLIDSADYTQYPSPYVIRNMGSIPKEIAITFDDGPDPVYTPQLLNILQTYHVPATFFLIGSKAETYPGIVSAIWKDGNELGNHTFSHPHLAEVSPIRAELEVNATQRAIENITGHSTRLFRPPFGEGADSNVVDTQEANLLIQMQRLGYLTVGMNIIPRDYLRPGAQAIADNVMHELTKGNIILLHDGGGDRSQTVEALPKIIEELRAKGYRLVTVSQLLDGIYTKDFLFPDMTGRQTTIAGLDRVAFETGFTLRSLFQLVFLLSIIFGIMKVILIAPAAVLQSRKRQMMADYVLPVTVLIPAYNESNVISRTIQSILSSDYHNLQVIIIDDGSTDGTSDVVRSEFGSDDRVSLVVKENGGKASALNMGFNLAHTEIVVCMDADTIFAKDAVSKLVRHFADPAVGAVAGNVKIGNRNNPLTIWQSLEYITSQNFDRRAFSLFSSVAVVPGAIDAWRKSVVMEAGGYDTNTLAEDTDLTFKVRLLGHKTIADNEALAFTEAPDTVRDLAKQRFRWAFGTLQCLWKYRKSLFNLKTGVFGMVVLPSLWIYNIAFQLFAPLVDIMAIYALFNHEMHALLFYCSILFAVDLLGSVVACVLDKENPTLLIWLFWQRFFYRQFMYYIILKAMINAVRGSVVGWGKLQRKANATLPS